MTLQEVFTSKYLFDPIPPQQSRWYLLLSILFGLMVAFAICFSFLPAEIKKITKRFALAAATSGALGYLYLLGRHEGLSGIGSRFFLLMVFAIFFIWNLINIIWLVRYLPSAKAEKLREDKYSKYLPKPKKKK